jgi:phosphate transport system substrate-binding protein
MIIPIWFIVLLIFGVCATPVVVFLLARYLIRAARGGRSSDTDPSAEQNPPPKPMSAKKKKTIAALIITPIFIVVALFCIDVFGVLDTVHTFEDGGQPEVDQESRLSWDEQDFIKDYEDFVTETPFALGGVVKGPYGSAGSVEEFYQSYGSYPYIDGSTVCIPMAMDFAMQHLDLSKDAAADFCEKFTKTEDAYANLIERSVSYQAFYYAPSADSEASSEFEMLWDRPVDLFLGTGPSDEELAMAAANGVELIQKPVCLDAFVFIVNEDNPIDSLTTDQARGIYSGRIRNWSEVGGRDEEIVAFQRDKNSGSQTAMETLVMKGEKLIEPKLFEEITGMGEMIEGVADYDNGKNSIGYTYRYFLDVMYGDEQIKMLKIDGTAPDETNIRDGSYVYATYYYGVIRGEDADGTGGKFLDWILSDVGQDCVRQAGYIPVNDVGGAD